MPDPTPLDRLRPSTRVVAVSAALLGMGLVLAAGSGVPTTGAGSPSRIVESVRPERRSPPATAQAPVAPTWARDVAPLLHANCATCHRDGGSAPFPLLTYQDAAPRADRIAEATRDRRMPPWLPDPDVADFLGARRLPERDIEILRTWAEAGAPSGDLAAAPEPPDFDPEWSGGPPDAVVEFRPYTVPAGGLDLYRNLVARAPVERLRWVRSVELRPGDVRVVHHARVMVDTTGSSRALAEEEAAAERDVMHVSGHAHNPEGFFVGWTPGKGAGGGRDDLAWRIDPGTDVVLQLHLRPGEEPRTVRPRLGLHFAGTPPERTAALVMLRSLDIDIPPGDTAYAVTDRYRLPVAVEVISTYPHAHYLGKRIEGWAMLPGGERRDVLLIRAWDFNWQDEYRYRRPVRLPAGSVLTMRVTYDNSAGNPQNPFDPPRRIVYGLKSIDEMAELTFRVVPADAGDLATLRADLDRFYYEADLDAEVAGHLARARALEWEGKPAEALEAYREALLRREEPGTLAAMAAVLLGQGDAASAVFIAERAAALADRPEPRVLATLARSYAAAGRGREARRAAAEARAAAARAGLGVLADSMEALARALREGAG